jgi:hypothetical protein
MQIAASAFWNLRSNNQKCWLGYLRTLVSNRHDVIMSLNFVGLTTEP